MQNALLPTEEPSRCSKKSENVENMNTKHLTVGLRSLCALMTSALCVSAQDATITNTVFELMPSYKVGISLVATNGQELTSGPDSQLWVLWSTNLADHPTNWNISPFESRLLDDKVILPGTLPFPGGLPPCLTNPPSGDPGPPPPGGGGGSGGGTNCFASDARFFRLLTETNQEWEAFGSFVPRMDPPFEPISFHKFTVSWGALTNQHYYVLARPDSSYPGWYMVATATNGGAADVYLDVSWPTNTQFRVFGLEPDTQYFFDKMRLELPQSVTNPSVVAVPYAVRLPEGYQVSAVELLDMTTGQPVPGSYTEGSADEMRIPGACLEAGTRDYQLLVHDPYGGIYYGPTNTMMVNRSQDNLVTITYPLLSTKRTEEGQNKIITDIGTLFLVEAHIPSTATTNGDWILQVYDDPLGNGVPGVYLFGGTYPADGHSISITYSPGSSGFTTNHSMLFTLRYDPGQSMAMARAAEPKIPDPNWTNWISVKPASTTGQAGSLGVIQDPALRPNGGPNQTIWDSALESWGDLTSIFDTLITAQSGCLDTISTGVGDSRNIRNAADYAMWDALPGIVSMKRFKTSLDTCNMFWQTNNLRVRSACFVTHANATGPGWASARFSEARLDSYGYDPKTNSLKHAFFYGCSAGAGTFLHKISNHSGADTISAADSTSRGIPPHAALGHGIDFSFVWQDVYIMGAYGYYAQGPNSVSPPQALSRAESEVFGTFTPMRIVCSELLLNSTP